MSIKTDYILTALQVIAWVIFVGLCIEACGIITKMIASLFLSPAQADKFWQQINLDSIHLYNESIYVTIASTIVIVVVLKAIMFYLIVRIFQNKHVSIARPFNETTNRFVLKLGYLSLGIGLFSLWGAGIADGLAEKKVIIPDLRYLKLSGGDVWMFTGVLLLVVAYMFKKGIEIQTENDLTV
jgi:hypothetical protein